MRNLMTNTLPAVYHSGFHLLRETVHQLQETGTGAPLSACIAAEGTDLANANSGAALLALGNVEGETSGSRVPGSNPDRSFKQRSREGRGRLSRPQWRGQREIIREVMAENISVDEGLAQLVAAKASCMLDGLADKG